MTSSTKKMQRQYPNLNILNLKRVASPSLELYFYAPVNSRSMSEQSCAILVPPHWYSHANACMHTRTLRQLIQSQPAHFITTGVHQYHHCPYSPAMAKWRLLTKSNDESNQEAMKRVRLRYTNKSSVEC